MDARLRRTAGCFLHAILFLPFFAAAAPAAPVEASATDDFMFIHHSSGGHWMLNNIREELTGKEYVDEFNDIGYTSDVPPDDGRPDSLTFSNDGLVPGDHTDVCHWVRWFNDYWGRIKTWGCATGVNRIVMFKSCYPNSNVGSGSGTGDPFSDERSLANYKAVFRHPAGPGNAYAHNGFAYKPLEDIFAENPDTLFIYVTAPPLLFPGSTDPEHAARAREFNNWLKTAWLDGYNAAHPGLNNVAVFDWFDVLAIPEGEPNANTLRPEYASGPGDNHPNDEANSRSTQIFATDQDNFIDAVWNRFVNASTPLPQPPPPPPPAAEGGFAVYPNPYLPGSGGPYGDTALGKGIVFDGLDGYERIRIFTVGGEIVKNVPTGGAGRYLWDGTDDRGEAVASGVYTYMVTSPGAAHAVKGRFSILR